MSKRKQPTEYRKRGYYHIRFYDADGTRRSRATGLKVGEDDAAFQIAFHTFCIEHNKPQQRNATEYMIATALDNYWEEHGKYQNSASSIRYHIDRLLTFWGKKTVSQINRQTSKEYWTFRFDTGVSPATVRTELAKLNAACNHERKEGRLEHFAPAVLPQDAPPRERWLTRDEIDRLYAEVKTNHTRLYLDIALNTGQRMSAILELKWFQIDFRHRMIRFNPSGRNQTIKERSTVPINEYLFESLLAAKKRATSEYVVEYKGERVKHIRKAVERCAGRAKLKGVSPHTLRHTVGTLLALDGASDYEIGSILGHSSPKTTRKYTKHAPHHLHGVVARLDKTGDKLGTEAKAKP